MVRQKISYGLALCRYNKLKNNQTEILLIKKRYTYYFFSFIFGHYKKYDESYLMYLFNNMSYQEKIDILSMQFNIMWYRIWLNNPEKNFNIKDIYTYYIDYPHKEKISNIDIYKLYFKKKKKFEQTFLNDGGKKLRKLITESTDSEVIWEIPKGGKNDGETNIDCALREFSEETSLLPNSYYIKYEIPPIIETYKDNGIIYKNVYFMAEIKNDTKITPRINYKNMNQILEVEQIKWVALQELYTLTLNKKSLTKLINLYKKILKKYKKSKKIKPPQI